MDRRAEQESCGFICLLSPSVAKQEGKHKKRERWEQKTNIKKMTMKELFWVNMKTSDRLVSHRDWPWEICVLTSEAVRCWGEESFTWTFWSRGVFFRNWAKSCIIWTWTESSEVLSCVYKCNWVDWWSTAGVLWLDFEAKRWLLCQDNTKDLVWLLSLSYK